MAKFSVKKPFTILVMVITILILGIVSVTRMQTDLLPEISLPYIMIITTYPGGSPEKIEAQVCEPMESALGTITGVKNISSVSNENYGLVQLEFEDDTDMDSAMVKISSALDAVKDYLPEDCGTPSILEIGLDMMATQYLAVGYEGKTIEETSDFIEENVIPYIERQDGVAKVNSIGLVEKTIQVELDKNKVDALNNKILAKADDEFAKALDQLEEAKDKLEDSEESMAKNRKKLKDSEKELNDAQIDLADGIKTLYESEIELADGKRKLKESQSELDSGWEELAKGREQIEQSKNELENGKREYEIKKEETKGELSETETKLLSAKSELEASKTHLNLEIATLEGTNEAIDKTKEGIKQVEAGISGIKELRESINKVTAGASQAGMSINTIGEMEGMEGYGVLPQGTVAQLKGALSKLSINADSNTSIPDLMAALDNSEKNMQNTKADLEKEMQSMGSKTLNNTLIEKYKSSMAEIDANMSQVDEGLRQLYAGNTEAAIQMANAQTQMTLAEYQLKTAETSLASTEKQLNSAQEQIDQGWDQLEDGQKQIDDGWKKIDDGQKQIDDGWKQLQEGREQLADGQKQIDDGWEDYYDAVETFEKQKVEAIRHANADELLSLSTISQLLYAQNFEMPAGYIDDKDDNSWLLKVGENFKSVDELSDAVLCNIDDIGDVKISDVARVTVIDNALDSYAKINQDDAVILSIFKSSTSGTNEVSRACKKAINDLETKYDGLSIMMVMDQGDYITIIIKSLLQSMIIGAILAIIILAIFLKDVRPTIVVALSIPLSVLAAIVALYFSNISLNIMSLSGLALGIGMLVDNSIVVMENIYRLRGRGVEAPRAAVQGTKQVTGSIVASTLTTVCVYFPLVFTTGMVRDLMMPMSFAIIFCLLASLLVAMTLIPATSSTLLRNSKAKDHKFFDKIQDIYGNILDFCLKVKIIPLLLAIVLLALAIWRVINMGIVMLPEMTSNELQASMRLNEELTRDECYELAGQALTEIQNIDGVSQVAVMSGGERSLFVDMGSSEVDYKSYSYMIVMDEDSTGKEAVSKAVKQAEAIFEAINPEEYSVSSSMMDMSQLTGSGLSINIYGDDLDTLEKISDDVIDIVKSVDGFEEVTNGQEVPDQVIHLVIDRDKAISMGLSVAQIYMGIQDKMDAEKKAVSVNIDGKDMDIMVVTHIDPLTYDNLMDFTFEVSEKDDDGNTYTHDVALGEIAKENMEDGFVTIRRENQSRYITVSAVPKEGENVTLLTRELEPLINKYELPSGYTLKITGEFDSVMTMIKDMILVLLLGFAFIYLVMVAQFQSLLSPFIVIFTVPLAFTGGLIGLWFTGESLSITSMMGFVLLLGTVVNNGIVFVDYTNQLRKQGLDRHTALIATGKTRMRPILMTAMTTIFAMSMMMFGDDMGSQMGKGMAIVVAGGLLYATIMTLIIVPVMYDILYKRQPLDVDTGSEDLDDVPDDAAEYIENMNRESENLTKDDDKKRKYSSSKKVKKVKKRKPIDKSNSDDDI